MLRLFVDEDASPEEKLIIEGGVVKNASKIISGLTEIKRTKEIKEDQEDIIRLAKMMAVIEVCGEVDPNIFNFCRNSDGKIVKIDHNYSLEDTISIPTYYANMRVQPRIIDYFKKDNLFQETLKKTITDIKQFDVKYLFSEANLGKQLYDALYKEQIDKNEVQRRVAEKCKEDATQFGVHKEPDHPLVLLAVLQNRIKKKSAQYGVSDDNDDVVVPESNKKQPSQRLDSKKSNKPELVRNPKKHTQKKSPQDVIPDDDNDDVVVPKLNKEPKKLRLPNISKEPNKPELGPSITQLKSLKDCAKHIIDIARNPKDKNGNKKVVLFDIDDCIITTYAREHDSKAIYLLTKLKDKEIELGICSTSAAPMRSNFFTKDQNIDVDIKGFSGYIELNAADKKTIVSNIGLDKDLNEKQKKAYIDLFQSSNYNGDIEIGSIDIEIGSMTMHNDKNTLILTHYVYQKYFKGNNKVDITYLNNDIRNFITIKSDKELSRLIEAKLLTITTIPMSSMPLEDPKRARQPIKDTFTTEALVKEIKNIVRNERSRTTDEKKKVTSNHKNKQIKTDNRLLSLDPEPVNSNIKASPSLILYNKTKKSLPKKTPLKTEQDSIKPKVRFGLNPAYKEDNKILSLYYESKNIR